MLDIQFIRDNPNQVKQACVNKNLNSSLVGKLLKVDEKRRSLIPKVDKIKSRINNNAKKIKEQVAGGSKPSPELIQKGKDFKIQLKNQEPELKEVEKEYRQLMLEIPNVPAEDVPVGKDEEENQIVRTEGNIPEFDFNVKDHQELMENLNLLDIKRGVKVAGFRGFFLKNQGVLLEQAILNYAMELMASKGFSLMSAPTMVNKDALVGTGYFPWGKEDHYVTQDGQLLTGTSEVAVTSYHAGEILSEKDLPIQMTALSPCFRREVGSYGKDTKGIIRVHQFNKVEQVVYTVADEEETIKWHEKMLGFSEELLQNLGLPYQVLLMCTGDMGAGQRKKYDIETWFPSQQKYRETHSASYFLDFQSRRLNIRYQAKDGKMKYVYTLNNTVAATPRLLAAIVENNQRADGSIVVPEVLRRWINQEVIQK